MIMSFLRSILSAQTPAKGVRRNVGRNPQMMNTVIIIPDFVASVTCHIRAY